MFKKLLPFVLAVLFQYVQAQNEFITIWKPSKVSADFTTNVSAPSPSTNNQIWFPGTGNNYTISWEEVGFPQHQATLNSVTSAGQILISFGTPYNPTPSQATYRVKVSNGNGVFHQFKSSTFAQSGGYTHHGNGDKLLEIAQWGNVQWVGMHGAFAFCPYVQITATDSPNLSSVEDASYMFYNAGNLLGHSSMANWNTSHIKDFSFMFVHQNIFGPSVTDNFNAPVGNWNTSSAVNFEHMFENRAVFNQNLNSWNTANVTNMRYMFASCTAFNQPLHSWNTSNVTDMSYMFHYIPNFNQPLNSWDISNVTDISHMFHLCTSFNQPLNQWDTGNVTNMNTVLQGASSFNQTLQNWNLPMLTSGMLAITASGIDCDNYSDTLTGWADNPQTANNINLGPLIPLNYSSDVIDKRNVLISKGWVLNGDMLGECRKLTTEENTLSNRPSIFPNPATDFIHLNNIKDATIYLILDAGGRVISKDKTAGKDIPVKNLVPGYYVLQVVTKDKTYSFKFIKK